MKRLDGPRRSTWRSALLLFNPYRREQLAVVVCVLAGTALLLVPAFVMQNLFDRAFPTRDRTLIAVDAAILLATTLGAAMLQVLQAQTNAWFSLRVVADLRVRLLAVVQAAPVWLLAETKTGELLNRVSNDVDRVEQVLLSVFLVVVSGTVSLVTTAVVLLVFDWKLALLAFAMVPTVAFAVRYTAPRLAATMARYNESRDRSTALLHDLLSLPGSILVRTFSREGYEQQRFSDVNTQLMHSALSVARTGSLSGSLLMAVIGAATPLMVVAGGLLLVDGHLTLGTLTGFLTLLPRLFAPVMSLATLQTQVAGSISMFERIFEYVDQIPREPDRGSSTVPIENSIAFVDVGFSYSDAPVLDGVSFEVRPGEVVAIIGDSGAGKSTIANLLLRFIEPQRGVIRFGGVDAQSIAPRQLRERISIVSQDTYLVHDTVENNIRFARPAAGREHVVAAAATAQIDEFIRGLPDGYDTIVGESGYKLSGGQRQRIAIARSILKDAQVLILDEATNALDELTELAVQSSLAALMRGRTCIVIAHRLGSVRFANRVYQLARGRLTESPLRNELAAAAPPT